MANSTHSRNPDLPAVPPARILLCVSGSIAAYKAVDLVSLLRAQGHTVRCLLTAGGERFVSPLVLESLSGFPVRRELFPETEALEQGQIEHIALARWADLIVFAPASANLLARLAHGLCDDLVTSVALATRAPTLIAPAMNTAMWEHPATQANLETLRARGAEILPPAAGKLACGEEGVGKFPPPQEVVAAIEQKLAFKAMAPTASGTRLLITAGPTISRLDAVRYLTNPSTGKMGAALAESALQTGCEVFYVLGLDKGVVRPRVSSDQEKRFHLKTVETAEEMAEASLHWLPQVAGVIATAAVLDYRITTPTTGKKKRSEAQEHWTLEPSIDVLQTLVRSGRHRPWFCGFAAETDALTENGREKLKRKGLDFLFANAVARAGEAARGFGTDQNAGTLLCADTDDALLFPEQPKTLLAQKLLQELLARTHYRPAPARHAAPQATRVPTSSASAPARFPAPEQEPLV